jgi:hypothetical protein
MLTALAILGGALLAWQSYRALDLFRLKSTLTEAYGPEIAAAIIDDQREMNWAALKEWRNHAALYRLLREELGPETARGIVRAVVLEMANDSLSEQRGSPAR